MKYLIIKWQDNDFPQSTVATIYKIRGLKYLPYLAFSDRTHQWLRCSRPQHYWTLKQIQDFHGIEDWGTLEDKHIFPILL